MNPHVTWLGAVEPAFTPTKTLKDIVPSVRSKFQGLLSYATSQGLQPKIRSAGRTCAQQQEQLNAGYSQAALCRSMHTLGHAIDIDITPATCANYTKLGQWWEKQGGVWGGHWKQFGACGDAGHFQYGFGGAQAVPTSVCPGALSLADCEELRRLYLASEFAKGTGTPGKSRIAALGSGLLIIGVGVAFVWGTLNVKPGRRAK